MRRILLIALFLITAGAAQAIPLAQTTASSLNVRVEPEGYVVVSLPRHTVVGVVETQGDWTKIMYFPGSDPSPAKHGWVSTNYLQAIKPETTAPDNEVPVASSAAAN